MSIYGNNGEVSTYRFDIIVKYMLLKNDVVNATALYYKKINGGKNHARKNLL